MYLKKVFRLLGCFLGFLKDFKFSLGFNVRTIVRGILDTRIRSRRRPTRRL